MFKFFVNFKRIDGIGTGSTICIIGKVQKLCTAITTLQNSISCFLLHVSSYYLMTSIAGLTCEKMASLFNVTTKR